MIWLNGLRHEHGREELGVLHFYFT